MSNGSLMLKSLSFEHVEFTLTRDVETRVVRVNVISGSTWHRAVRFPSFDSETTQSTGDEELDAAIRRRAGEELIRLEAIVRYGRAS